jgi:probable phosphoglycerate mutase
MNISSSTDITRIYVVRHGQTNFNKEGKIQGHANNSPDNDINETGVYEATELAKKLSKTVFDQIFSSDLNRALQTCDIIAAGRAPLIDVRIRERNWKEWEGRLMDDFNLNEIENWKHVESDQSVRDRAMEFFTEIGESYKNQNLLVVCHGGLMRNILIRILNLSCEVGDIKAGNTSYYTLEYSAGAWSLGKTRSGLQFPGEEMGSK